MSTLPYRPPLRLGLVQFRPGKARPEENLDRIRERVREAQGRTDLLVFPEAALSGYFLEGGVQEVALPVEEVAEGLGDAGSGSPDVVVGFYERWRGRIYNSAAYLTPDGGAYRPLHVHRKVFLPTYGIFQEARFVEAGTELRTFDTRFGRLGMLVCEDLWHSLAPTVLAVGGAELVVVVSATPARDFQPSGGGPPGNLERWDRLAVSTAAEHGIFLALNQLVGTEGGKLLSGGSQVVGPDGRVLARGPFLEEATVEASLDGTAVDRARFESPLLADLEQTLPHLARALDEARSGGVSGPSATALGGGGEPPATGTPSPDDASVLDLDLSLVEELLVEFVRGEIRGRGFERVVLGVSGGVDSSVSLFLACRALGPGNVNAFRLPYATSTPESLEHAARITEELGAPMRTIDITSFVDGYVDEHEPEISDRRRGNVAARIRALILFDQSAKLDALPLGTGNKSERLLGYFTWHADDSPPVNPLGDLFKTQVWALARHLGVPEEIVSKPPSAELVRGVDDEDELGISYSRADLILHWLLHGFRPEELVTAGFDPDDVETVRKRLGGTHWKRRTPTVALLSSSAIGESYLRPVDY